MLKFTKMHGTGNDYIAFETWSGDQSQEPEIGWEEVTR